MTIVEAATVLGATPEQVRDLQIKGMLPDPIPDGHFDAIIKFRIDLEMAFRRKIDAKRGVAS